MKGNVLCKVYELMIPCCGSHDRYLDAPDTVHGDEAARLLDTLLLLQLQQ
jgi:hypothetical protein